MDLDATGNVFVWDLPPPEHLDKEAAESWDLLEILVRLPLHLRLPEARFCRSGGELLQMQLVRMASKLGPKPAKSKKQRQSSVAMPSLCLVDGTEAAMILDAPSAESWRSARALQIAGLSGSDCASHLPIFWNPPSASAIRVPSDSPVVGVPLLAEAMLRNCTSMDCQWVWESAASEGDHPQCEWREVSRGAIYSPVASDAGRQLRVCCQPPFPGDLARSVPSKQPTQWAPQDCWRWDVLPPAPSTPSFRLATYNVLADAYAGTASAKKNIFSYCADGVLAAPKRRQLILRDFLKMDADIVGLQEVDSGQLAAMAPLSTLGWDNVYTRKGGAAADGCALLWRRARFQVESPPFELRLGGPLDTLPGLEPTTIDALRIHEFTKDVLAAVTTVAQGVLLRDTAVEGRRLLVANTHLFYHPNANHIRVLQLHMLLSELARRAEAMEADGLGPVAVILLGDLNARKGSFGPSDRGNPPQAAYRLIRDGAVLADDVDWLHSLWRPDEWRSNNKELSASTGAQSYPSNHSSSVIACICCDDLGVVNGYGVCPLCEGLGLAAWDAESGGLPPTQSVAVDADQFLRLELQLPLPLIDPNGHLEVTNFTADFQECLDYTLLDSRQLQAARCIAPPTLEQLRAETALPSSIFPSDHIPVIVDVAYRVPAEH